MMKTSISGVIWGPSEAMRRELDAENKRLLVTMFRDPLPVPRSVWMRSSDPKVAKTAEERVC